jgi:diguanylate cyclase (GGDEF)-like protein
LAVVDDFAFADEALARTVRQLMEGLRRSVENDELRDLLHLGLKRFSKHGAIDGRCIAWLHDRLSLYAKDSVNLPRSRIKARLIQQHLSIFLPPEVSVTPVNEPTQAVAEPEPEPAPPPAAAAPRQEEPSDSPAATTVRGTPDPEPATSRRARYEELRRSEQDAWEAIYGTVKDFNQLKTLWASSLDELTQERDELAGKLAAATARLQHFEQETNTLRTELVRLRDTDQRRPARSLPKPASRAQRRTNALAKRDLFMRQLEAEAERVKRHGTPFALALMNIDSLEAVGQYHGDDAAKTVRRRYAAEILAGFRTYDIVARYRDDEFALLFPNTTRDGAVRAIEKAQKRATETHFTHDGSSFPLPGFTAVLTVFTPGEEPSVLLDRTSQRLEEAKQHGEQLVVM